MDFSTSAPPNSLQECKKFHRPPSYKFPASAPELQDDIKLPGTEPARRCGRPRVPFRRQMDAREKCQIAAFL
jgi:hypothetical protein